MVGRHVGEHARLVRRVAHAAQQDPAAGRLEDRDVHVGPPEDHRRAARPGPVAGLDQALVDEDAVRRRRPDVAAGPEQDVGDEPRDGGLAVRPADRDDGDAALRVADPGRRGRPCRRDPCLPRLHEACLRPREARAAIGGHAAAPARRRPPRSSAPALRRATARSRPSVRGRRAVDGDGAGVLPVRARRRRVHATSSATASGQSRAGTGRASRTSAGSAGIRYPRHARVRPTETSTLTIGSSR